MKFRIWKALLGLLLALAPLRAQNARGTILGRVTDQSGAAMDAVKIEVVNTDTGVRAASSSNSSGDYIVPYLLAGPYNIAVEHQGFKRYTRTGVMIREGDRISIDVSMQLGDSAQTVDVSSMAPMLDTSTASMGNTVGSRAIEELPTKDGMVLIMATFAPGVTFTPQSAGYIRPFDTASPSAMSVNGTRPGSNEFQVDGTPNLQGQQIAYSPPQSVVSEMKVQTSTFDASTGFNTGAVMNMTLKTGANRLHGQVDYFMQNPALNADNYFRLSTGKPGFRIHRYGASATGPVVLPKVYDGKNRTFFTYGYEAIWSFDPSPWVVETVPTAAERKGDFSSLLAISPAYQIYDPYSTTPAGNGRFQRTPVPGNIIPPNRINPVSAKIASLWDQPNQPNQPGTIDGTNNYTMGKNAQDTYWNHLFRLDHNISAQQRLYGRVNVTSLERPENIRQNKTVGDNFYRYNHGAVLDYVNILSPSFVMDARYSFMRFTTGYTPYQQGWDLASLGFAPGFVSQLQQLDTRALKFPNINIGSIPGTFSPLGGVNSNNQQIYMIHEGAVNFTNTFGAHTLRSGVTYRGYLENAYDLGSSSGALTFDSTWTGGPLNTSGPSPIGQDFASFLYGLPASGSLPVNDSFAQKQSYWAFFAQDDWKVSTKLTLSLGLRYELPSSLTERFNRSVRGFDSTASSSISSKALQNYALSPIAQVPASAFNVNGGLTFAGVNGSRDLWNRSTRNFMPRFGFAYSLAQHTVLRGGYGIYYSPLGVTFVNVNQTGFNASTAFVGSLDNGQTYTADLTNPFPGGVVRPLGASGGASTFLGQNVGLFDQNLRNPYAQRWQFAVQHELPGNVLVELSYVGNRGTRLLTTQDLNAFPAAYLSTLPTRDQATINALGAQVPNPFYPLLPRTNLAATTVATSQLLRPFPQFSGITQTTNGGASWYHALQARTEKRFSSGFYGSYSFSWSKFMEAITYLNPTDTRPEHVVSDQDRPFRSVVTWGYELPFGAGKPIGASVNRVVSTAISGWQMQGIYTYQSGQALGFGNAILLCGPGDITLSPDQRTVKNWFNTSCFNRTSNQQLASNIRTVSTRFSGIRGPSLNNFDLSFIKNTRIREGVRLQFQAEAINALNHPQFTNPTTTPTSSAFGQVTGTFSWQRVIEFGMKLSF